MKKVLIAGTFDIIHPGHINLIKQAKELGNFVVAVIARDQNVLKTKGHAPYFNEKRRMENLKKFNLIDKVILGDLIDPYKVVMEEKPDIIALGYDQKVFINGLNQLQTKNSKIKTIKLQPFKEDFCKGKNVRKAIEDKDAGFLLINKPMNWTSHDVVAKLRSIIKIKQIGHTGTLDPFATGLLICAVSNAAKMVGLFDLLPKTYEATIKLGIVSNTFDRTGEVSSFKYPSIKEVPSDKLVSILNTFIGQQQQLPPMYSAKKVQGKKLYNLARKGIEIERQSNQIEIYNIEFLGFKGDILDIKVECSAGTYIRTLAYDIGQKLGCGAVLFELKRTAIGDFNLNNSINLETVTASNWQQFKISPLRALEQINEIVLSF